MTSKQIFRHRVIVSFVIVALSCHSADSSEQDISKSHEILIKRNGFSGCLRGSSLNHPRDVPYLPTTNEFTTEIKEDHMGLFWLNTGATVGNTGSPVSSYIQIFFSEDGLVSEIQPTVAASINDDKKGISLNTIEIIVDPKEYNEEWNPSFGEHDIHGRVIPVKDKKSFRIMPSQRYLIDFNKDSNPCLCDVEKPEETCVQGSDFYFVVTPKGKIAPFVISSVLPVNINENTLEFKTAQIRLDPADFGGRKVTVPRGNKRIALTEPKTFNFVSYISQYLTYQEIDGTTRNFLFVPM